MITYALYQTISINMKLFSIALPFIFFVSAVASHFIQRFKMVNINAQAIACAKESNLEEISGLIGQGLITNVLVGLALSMVILYIYNKSWSQCRTSTKIRTIALSAIVTILFALYSEFPSPLPLPFGLFEATFTYAREQNRFKNMSRNKQDISLVGTLSQEGNEDITVVLIIGESARPDHFHINGYARETSPNLERIGVISFGDVTSCGVTTRESVPCMMTRATSNHWDPSIEETSLVSVFRRLGFHTAWISNQRVMGQNDTPVTSIAKEAASVYFGNKGDEFIFTRLVDEDLLGVFDQNLHQPIQKKLVVIHTVGSHWFLENHYTDAFRVYQPVCTQKEPGNCSIDELVNSYDNTILYTDHFIKEVIERVRDSNAIVFYVSDHGESLGEEGRFGHGQDAGYHEQKKVPFFIWASERYILSNAEKYGALRKHLDAPLSHDHLFHTILDCTGVRSPVIDPSFSLCK